MVEQWRSLNELHGLVQTALERELQAKHGVSSTENTVLDAMDRQKERHLRMHEVATVAVLSGSAATRLVNRLESRGLIARVLCDDDRRGIYSALTPAGTRLLEQAKPTHDATLNAALEQAKGEPGLEPLVQALLVTQAV
jgi:DNA-binding MarR family transcriptional regulator